MNLIFDDHAWEDYLYWQKTDEEFVKRINLLIKIVLNENTTDYEITFVMME